MGKGPFPKRADASASLVTNNTLKKTRDNEEERQSLFRPTPNDQYG
jgi:hypothetical protein